MLAGSSQFRVMSEGMFPCSMYGRSGGTTDRVGGSNR
jgi:hypothetical protein